MHGHAAEDGAALRHLEHAALDDLLGRQAGDVLVFEEDAAGGGAPRPEPPAVPRKGGKVNINFDPGPHGPKMTPPDPAQLAATLGDYFTPATANAVEAAPTNLRAPLILGSPEFMKR